MSEYPNADETSGATPNPYEEFEQRMDQRMEWVNAKWRRRSSANWGHLIQVGLLIVASIYAGLTYGLFKKSDATLSVITRQLEVTDRPWIKVDVESINPFSRVAENIEFGMKLVLTNVGKSVATNVGIEAEMFPMRWGMLEPVKTMLEPAAKQKALCDRARQGGSTPGERSFKDQIGLMVFPDDPLPQQIGVSMKNSDALDRAKLFKVPGQLPVIPMVVGCVDYRFNASDKHHQTGFIYQVIRIAPEHPQEPLMLTLDHMDLPVSNMRLVKFVFGGFYSGLGPAPRVGGPAPTHTPPWPVAGDAGSPSPRKAGHARFLHPGPNRFAGKSTEEPHVLLPAAGRGERRR